MKLQMRINAKLSQCNADAAKATGATDIKKNKGQIDASGNRVSTPDGAKVRPDAAYTDKDGTRVNTNYVSNHELDNTKELNREIDAFKTMNAADPKAMNSLKFKYQENKMKCPSHLLGFVGDVNTYFSILPKLTDYLVGYSIKCSCGCKQFSVLKNDRPLVLADCINCRKRIVLYDTKQYPYAHPSRDEGMLKEVLGPAGEKQMALCVAFEYPELEEDEEFDQNDITWAFIYGIPENNLHNSFCILDDETA